MAKKKRKAYECQACGNRPSKWEGQCSNCKEWNKIEEIDVEILEAQEMLDKKRIDVPKLIPIHQHKTSKKDTISTGSKEFDRVLGEGLTVSSMILIAGDPGIGKSTILLQSSSYISEHYGNVLYITGEESVKNIKSRHSRLGLPETNLFVHEETDIDVIEGLVQEFKPTLLIIDSIQLMYDSSKEGSPGGPAQIRQCTERLRHMKKTYGITIFLIGHVDKEGNVGGPRTLDHMVDTVLKLDGDEFGQLRTIRALKNRNGNINEVGIFQMTEKGMEDVPNPSSFLLDDRLEEASGSVVTCISLHRPILIEVQALVAESPFEGAPARRLSNGFQRDRMQMILSVLEKRAKQRKIAFKDVNVNVAGGMKINQPGVDLAVALAIYSSDIDEPIDQNPKKQRTIILGELGLPGEVRPVPFAEMMVKEAEKVGYTRCILPQKNYDSLKDKIKTMKLIPVRTIQDAIQKVFN